MTGQTVEIIGYVLCGVSGILLILSEFIFRRKKKGIVQKVYEDIV